MSIIIQKLKKNEIHLLKQFFKNTPIVSEHSPFNISNSDKIFKWQFFSEDYIECPYLVAHNNHDLLGTLAALIFPMYTPHENVCYTMKPEDLLINIIGSIKNKRKDLFQELLNKLYDEIKSNNIEFNWGFSDAVATFKRLGYDIDFKSMQGIYTFKIFSSYKHLAKLNPSNKIKQKVQILGLSIISYFKTFTYFNFFETVKCEKIDFNLLDYKILKSFLPKKLYSLYLDENFINWRILKNQSELEYGLLQFKNKEDKIVSYLIFSKKQKNIFFIEQFLFDDELSINNKKKIVYTALRYFKKQNAIILRAMGFDHNYKNKEELEIFKKVGFIFVKKGIPFIFKSHNKNLKSKDIYLSRLNTEGII